MFPLIDSAGDYREHVGRWPLYQPHHLTNIVFTVSFLISRFFFLVWDLYIYFLVCSLHRMFFFFHNHIKLSINICPDKHIFYVLSAGQNNS